MAEQENILDKLSMIDIPVLWIVGEKDEKYCKLGEQAVKFLKNAQLLKIRNSGHRVPWEAEAEVVDAITQFLNEAL